MLVNAFKISANQYKDIPWKNGGGITKELLIEPAGALVTESFTWRISMANVDRSGLFSCFPDIDRTLIILEGKGIELDHGAYGKSLLSEPLKPLAFPGEWETYGRLLDGQCLDFNVMSKRSKVRHNVSILYPGLNPLPLPQASTILVFCLRGSFSMSTLEDKVTTGELLRVDTISTNNFCHNANVSIMAIEANTIVIMISIKLLI